MTDTHAKVREMITRMSRLEPNAATDTWPPENNSGLIQTMNSIACLVTDLDAQIAALREDLAICVDVIEDDDVVIDLDAVHDTLTNTAATAAAHDARIRAEVIEGLAAQFQDRYEKLIPAADGTKNHFTTSKLRFEENQARTVFAAIRTMGDDDA